jgi:acetyl esterase/lipase
MKDASDNDPAGDVGGPAEGAPGALHPDSSIARQIRARGAVLDMPFTQSIYKSLLQNQRRDGVDVSRDLSYGVDSRHRLDVYRPQKESSSPRPVMIFLHGGGFIRGDKSDRENVGQHFARQGFVVIVANYRLAPAHKWPAGAEDVIAIYRWSRAHAAQFGADATRIFLAGESAGAAHVATATLVRRFHPPEGLVVAGVVLISGVYDVRLELLARKQFGVANPDPRNEAYFGTEFASYRDMSTVELIDAPPAPLLITYAELDLLQMQVQAGELFARLVTGHGYEPQLKVIRGHNHLTQTYAVNTGDESLSAPVLEFLRERAL